MSQPTRKLAKVIPLRPPVPVSWPLPAMERARGGRAALRRLYALLAVSAVAHAIVLVLAPGFDSRPVVELPKTLAVRLVEPPPAPAAPAPPSPPEKPAKAVPRARITPRAEPAPITAAAEPAPAPAPAPVLALPANPGAAQVAARPAEPVPVPVTPPSFSAAYLSNPAPPYPIAARHRHEEGLVLLEVLVSESGVPKEVRVSKSSGFSLLDEAAVEAVKGWKFNPAREGERPVAGGLLVPIRFRLEAR
jgi:periplasmic protein TonB